MGDGSIFSRRGFIRIYVNSEDGTSRPNSIKKPNPAHPDPLSIITKTETECVGLERRQVRSARRVTIENESIGRAGGDRSQDIFRRELLDALAQRDAVPRALQGKQVGAQARHIRGRHRSAAQNFLAIAYYH